MFNEINYGQRVKEFLARDPIEDSHLRYEELILREKLDGEAYKALVEQTLREFHELYAKVGPLKNMSPRFEFIESDPLEKGLPMLLNQVLPMLQVASDQLAIVD